MDGLEFMIALHNSVAESSDEDVEIKQVKQKFKPNGLTLKKQKSLFKSLVFNEKVTKEATNIYQSIQVSDKPYEDGNNTFNTDRKVLNHFVESSKNNNVKVEYKRVCGWGRAYPKGHNSIGVMKKKIRHSIAFNQYADIDIVNCHPVILAQICKKNNIECEKLDYYINNRENVLNDFMKATGLTRDDGKAFVISLMYGGTVYSFCKKNEIKTKMPYFFKQFEKEREHICDMIVSSNPTLVNDLRKLDKQGYNFDGCVTSYYLQEHERRILEHVYTFFVNNNVIQKNDCVLCYDGIMVNKNRFNDGMLEELRDYVFEKTGFNLDFAIKEMKPFYDISEQADQLKLPDDAKIELNKIIEEVTNVSGDGMLLELVKKNNADAYHKLVDKYLSHKIDTPKLVDTYDFAERLNLNQKYLTKDKNIDSFVQRYLNSDVKTLCIKSSYGTGKTTLIKDICNKYKRVLFVSYRVTLAVNIHGLFTGFKNYTDNIFDADKQIIQLDSITKLKNVKYDIIVLDEVEGLLNHLGAKTLLEKRKGAVVSKFIEVFDHLRLVCKHSKKVIALDGDIDDRSMVFCHNIEQKAPFYFINNTFKPHSYNIVFHQNNERFNKILDDNMKAGKKVCLISMSQSLLEDYYDKYRNENKIMFYTGNSDDDEKMKLKNVKNEWKGKGVSVFYSPTIESGVDYDTNVLDDTFDVCLMILSGKSTSQRGLCQMMIRIRKFKENTINVLLNGVPYQDHYNRYQTYNETKLYYKVIRRDSVDVDEDGNVIDSTRMKLLDVIQCHNKTEEVNKMPFLPKFIDMLKTKGHTIEEFDDELAKDKNTIKERKIVYQAVCSQSNITEEEKNEITQRIKSKKATSDDKYKIIKYWIQTISMTDLNEETTEKDYKDALKVKACIKNANDLIKGFTKSNNIYKKTRLNKFKQILNILNIDVTDINKNIVIPRDVFVEHIKEVSTIMKDNYLSFGINKDEVITDKNYSWALKQQFDNYGFDMTTARKSKKIDGKVSKVSTFNISINPKIKRVINAHEEYIKEFEQMMSYMPEVRLF